MNPVKAEAIRLYAEEGLNHREVADRVGRARGTVSGWLRGVRAVPGNRKPSKYEPVLPPQDTRTPGQRLMGEPVFERSALYQKMQGGS